MPDTTASRLMVKPGSRFSYKRRSADAKLGWSKTAARKELGAVVDKLDVAQQRLAAEGTRGLLVVLQSMDAGGKDGTIRDVFGPLNAAGVRVSSFKAPAGAELARDYLWRIHNVTPSAGELAVWNRSHYEDVLVARVKSIVTRERWERRYRHIREFERLLTDEGTRIVKINLHISFDEQRVRLQERVDDPLKRWKFRLGDLDDRKLWDDYMTAYEVAMRETSTEHAPWYVVPADRKWVRNLAVARIVLHVLDEMAPQFPPDDPAIQGLRVE